MADTMAMSDMGLPGNHDIRWFDELDSTNAEALRQAVHAPQQPIWIGARRQTQGRGRHGRRWESPIGNLMVSLLLPNIVVARAGELAFVAGLAIHRLVVALLGDAVAPDAVQLKWPNDVLVQGKKVSGILLEIYNLASATTPAQPRMGALVIGMGLNLTTPPSQAQWPASALTQWRKPMPTPKAVLPQLIEAFGQFHAQWQASGFAPLRAQWLAHAYGLGKSMQVRLGDDIIEGRFIALEDNGALCLDTPSGERVLLAGDVFFGAAQ